LRGRLRGRPKISFSVCALCSMSFRRSLSDWKDDVVVVRRLSLGFQSPRHVSPCARGMLVDRGAVISRHRCRALRGRKKKGELGLLDLAPFVLTGLASYRPLFLRCFYFGHAYPCPCQERCHGSPSLLRARKAAARATRQMSPADASSPCSHRAMHRIPNSLEKSRGMCWYRVDCRASAVV